MSEDLVPEPYAPKTQPWNRLPAPAASHPAPLVTARDAEAHETPKGARTVMKRAQAAGWAVRATYALGTSIDNRGNATRLVHSLALRMCDGRRRAVAVWTVDADPDSPHDVPDTGWKASGAYIWTPGESLPTFAKAAELTAYLTQED